MANGGAFGRWGGGGAMNQLTISAANAAARRISWSWCGFQFGCSWVPLSLLRHLHLHSSVHQRFLSHSSSLSPSLSVCGEWRGTESCRKHYVKWPPGLKIHPLHRATLATAAAGGSSSQTAWHATKHIQHVHIRRSICQMPQRTRAYCINTHTYTHRYIYSW